MVLYGVNQPLQKDQSSETASQSASEDEKGNKDTEIVESALQELRSGQMWII
jgi:hypothetical protein